MNQKTQAILRIVLIALYVVLVINLWRMWTNKPAQQAQVVRPASLLAQAERLRDARRYDKAAEIYQQIAKKYPKSNAGAEAQVNLALIHARNPKTQHQAIQEFRTALQQHGDRYIEVPADGGERKVLVREYVPGEISRLTGLIDRRNSSHILYKFMDLLVAATGRKSLFSYTLALVFLTLLVKAIPNPLPKAQFKQMAIAQRLQPEIREIQKKYKDKPEEQNRRILALYKQHGTSPLGGCLPMLIQFPLLWGVYYTIQLYQFQFAKGRFLWISDLSRLDMPLLLLYAVSMFLTTKLTATVTTDPQQRQQQNIMAIAMPLLLTYMLWSWQSPAAFILYWFLLNILSTWQQYHIMKQHPMAAPVAAAADSESPAAVEEAAPRNGSKKTSGSKRPRPRRSHK